MQKVLNKCGFEVRDNVEFLRSKTIVGVYNNKAN